jgi:hypothetical protein
VCPLTALSALLKKEKVGLGPFRARAGWLSFSPMIALSTNLIRGSCKSPLKDLEPSLRGEVKKNRPFQYFYLPPDGELTESFVDFAYPTTVSLSMVSGIPRLMTLSDLGRRALYVQYIRWVTRWEMRKIKCPGCGEDFNASAALPVRKD